MMDAVNDPEVKQVVLECSSQVGKTEILLNTLGYFIQHEPSPILVVQPTLDMAGAFSKDRVTPMLRDTPILNDLFAASSQPSFEISIPNIVATDYGFEDVSDLNGIAIPCLFKESNITEFFSSFVKLMF